MDKILELLGIDKLDESAQTEIQEKLQDIIDVKARELSESKLQEQKDQLIEEYEEKFNEYKDDITGKFSNFVDSVLDEEMIIPDKVVEYARKGELYSDLIEQFKTRLAVDEGILDEEVKGLLREAKEEILKLRESLDEKTASELELQKDAQEMAAALYLRKKCDGLTESQKTKVIEILEGITDKDEIDRKFKVVIGTITEEEEEEEEEGEDKKKKEKGEEEEEEEEEVSEGKGKAEVESKIVEEKDDSPFGHYIKEYLNVMKTGI
jgi:hypothetical protein